MPDRILAVIPCLNEEHYLAKLVENLVTANQNLPMRIVIADGGSTDGTQEIAKALARQYSNILFLYNLKRLQSSAVNLAVATYGEDADVLIRIDAHADYPKDYCQTLVDEADKTGAASIVVGMKTAGHTVFQQAVATAQNSKLGNGGSAHRMAGTNGMWVDHGHHALMRIAAFRSVGGYDESFSHNEDAELDTRLRKAGYKIWLTGKTTLTYYPRSSAWPLFKQYMQHGNGRARNLVKHRTIPKLRQMVPAAVLPAALLALVSPWCWIAALPLLAWIALCTGYGLLLGYKAHDGAVALAGIAAMIMHFAWSVGFWKAMAAAPLRHIR